MHRKGPHFQRTQPAKYLLELSFDPSLLINRLIVGTNDARIITNLCRSEVNKHMSESISRCESTDDHRKHTLSVQSANAQNGREKKQSRFEILYKSFWYRKLLDGALLLFNNEIKCTQLITISSIIGRGDGLLHCSFTQEVNVYRAGILFSSFFSSFFSCVSSPI